MPHKDPEANAMTTCTWWLCAHPISQHTDARGCTAAGCLCHYTAREAAQPPSGVTLAAVAWRNMYAVATRSGRVLIADPTMFRAEERDDR